MSCLYRIDEGVCYPSCSRDELSLDAVYYWAFCPYCGEKITLSDDDGRDEARADECELWEVSRREDL